MLGLQPERVREGTRSALELVRGRGIFERFRPGRLVLPAARLDLRLQPGEALGDARRVVAIGGSEAGGPADILEQQADQLRPILELVERCLELGSADDSVRRARCLVSSSRP